MSLVARRFVHRLASRLPALAPIHQSFIYRMSLATLAADRCAATPAQLRLLETVDRHFSKKG